MFQNMMQNPDGSYVPLEGRPAEVNTLQHTNAQLTFTFCCVGIVALLTSNFSPQEVPRSKSCMGQLDAYCFMCIMFVRVWGSR